MGGSLVIGPRFDALATTAGQLLRYGAAGLALNLALYLGYLGLTALDLSPRMAATLCFLAGIPLSFAAHRRVTFRAGAVSPGRKALFALAYLLAYAGNMLGLYLLVDLWQLPHQAVQLFLILLIAACLFVTQKLLIFRPDRAPLGLAS